MSQARVEALVDDVIDLIPLPKAYLRIRDLVHDPDSSANDVARLVENDPAMTARVLRVANSAYMGLITAVETIPRAVQVLGLNQVHDIALAMSAMGALQQIPSPLMDITRFWRRSIYTAVSAKLINDHYGRRGGDRVFVAGLLHDIGHLVLAYRETETAQAAMDAARTSDRALAEAERELFGFDYAAVSAALLKRWDLPEALVAPVAFHTRPGDYEGEVFFDVAVLQVASTLARAALWKSEEDEPVPAFDPACMALVKVDEDAIETLMAEADQQVIEAMQLLLPNSQPKATATA